MGIFLEEFLFLGWGGAGLGEELEFVDSYFPFPFVLVSSSVPTVEEFSSHFLSAPYLSFHLALQLGDLLISPSHPSLFLLQRTVKSMC